MSFSKGWRHVLVLVFLCLIGCSDGDDNSEKQGAFDSVLGIKDTLLPLEFTYKPGFVGTTFVDKGVALTTGKTGQPVQRVANITVDKIEYIQNYMIQKKNPDFVIIEGRDLLIRVHAYANISNITAPDMRIIIEGPSDIKYSVRLPATGGLPGMPENSGQAVDYTRILFTQAYLFKIPAEHVVPGTYKMTLEALPKPDSGLSSSKHEDTFTVTAQAPAIKIRLYEGILKDKHATVPSPEQIKAVIRKFWPVGEVNIEKIQRPVLIELPYDEKELFVLAEEARLADESVYLKSKYLTLLQGAVKELNFTRNLTQSEAIELLIAPVPEGGAHYMQSILISDKDWEMQLAQQFGHALGLGTSPECALSIERRRELVKKSKPMTIELILKEAGTMDEGDATFESMEEYRWEQRYWTLEWKEGDKIKISSPREYSDLMSSCKKRRFPHLYYYGKSLTNMLNPVPEQPLLNHPSALVRDFYKTNGLARGLAVRVQFHMDGLRKALIQKQYAKIPVPQWTHTGELKRMMPRESNIRSPHAVVLEGADGKTNRVIELFLSTDKQYLVGVTSLMDLPKPVKRYGLYINKVRVASGQMPKIFNKNGAARATAGQKGNSFLIKWDAKEVYTAQTGLVIYTAYGQKAELVAIGLKQGMASVEAGTMDPHQGAISLLLPYSRSSIFGGLDEGVDILTLKPRQ